MKPIHSLAVAALLALPAAAAAQEAQGHLPSAEAVKAGGDIIETAGAAGSFTTLVAAIEAAGLTATLKGEGPFTVFAPTDAAFAKLPEGTLDALLQDRKKLAAILTYHVVPAKVSSADAARLRTATTVNGQDVEITAAGGTVMVETAAVTRADIPASNGVIHVIDAVLLPE